MLLRGCISAKISIGGIYKYERKIVTSLSAYAITENCFIKKKS